MGAPYFNRFFIPVGLGLLFLMAVAPALPWRKTSVEVMRGRLAVPAAIGVAVVVACVAAGIHGVEPLLAFGLGAFAAASAGRALVLSVRGACRSARRPGRSSDAGRPGRVARIRRTCQRGHGRAHRGGRHRRRTGRRHLLRATGARCSCAPGSDGHASTGTPSSSWAPGRSPPRPHSSFEAVLRVDGRGAFTPAISQFGTGTQAVGTPAIDSSWTGRPLPDHRLHPGRRGPSWTFGVVEQPLVMWLWIGGGLIGVGSVLSAVPGRRRRPTDPVSAPVRRAFRALPGGARTTTVEVPAAVRAGGRAGSRSALVIPP